MVVSNRGLDIYGRTLGVVFVDTINVNEKMIAEGMAWHFKRYDNNDAWAQMEIIARTLRKGLWIKNSPIPPWECRHLKKKKKRA